MVEQATEQTIVAENETVEAATPPAPLFDDILKFVDADVKESKSLTHFKGKKLEEALPLLIKNYVHAQQLTGKKVGLFSEDEIREFVQLPVKPKSADDYLTAIEDADLELVDKFKDTMYNMGLDTKQATAFLNMQKEAELAALANKGASAQELAEAAENELHEKFGLNYRKAMDIVRQAADSLGGEDLVKKVLDVEVKDPAIIEALYKIGKEIGAGKVSFKETPAAAVVIDNAAERAKLLADPEFKAAYLSASHPAHAKAVEKMNALYS